MICADTSNQINVKAVRRLLCEKNMDYTTYRDVGTKVFKSRLLNVYFGTEDCSVCLGEDLIYVKRR